MYIMKLRIRAMTETVTMVKTIGCGEVVSTIPTRALDKAAMPIWMKPSKADAVPAICGNGRSAMAIELGSTNHSAVEKKAMGII